MSSSIVSSQMNALNNSIANNQMKSGQSILHTGGTQELMDESSRMQCESVSSRSMSPVGEEINNIKKLKVDLT